MREPGAGRQQAAAVALLRGSSQGVSPQTSSVTNTTGLTPQHIKRGVLALWSHLSRQRALLGVFAGHGCYLSARDRYLHPCCTHTAPHPDPRCLDRGSLVTGISGALKGSSWAFPPGCVSILGISPSTPQLRRAKMGDAMRAPEVSQ